jgi:AcrR family transcriptional regulator
MAGTTRSLIMERARILFSRRGFDAASMEDIARQVGIRKASLYAHFRGKQAIFREVFASVLDEYARFLGGTLASLSGQALLKDRLASLLVAYAGYFRNTDVMSFWFRVSMMPPAFMKKEFLRETLRVELGFVDRLTGVFREGMKSGELKRQNAANVSTAFYQLVMGLGMTLAFYPVVNSRKLTRDCLGVFWRGIGTEGSV